MKLRRALAAIGSPYRDTTSGKREYIGTCFSITMILNAMFERARAAKAFVIKGSADLTARYCVTVGI